jgi:hypothetical protein
MDCVPFAGECEMDQKGAADPMIIPTPAPALNASGNQPFC